MISKTGGPSRDTTAPSAPADAAQGSRHPSKMVRDTLRELHAATQHCVDVIAGAAPDAREIPPASEAAPSTAQAIIAPATAAAPSAATRIGPRDALALAGMARVRERAAVQHAGSRAAFETSGTLPNIDPDYLPIHRATPLHLKGVGGATSFGTRPYQQDVAVADWHDADGIGIAAVCDGHGIEAPGDIMPWHWLQANLVQTLRAHLPTPEKAMALGPHRVCQLLTRAIAHARAEPRAPLSVLENMHRVNAVDNGATLNAAVRLGRAVYMVNVGDSRAVLVRRDGSAVQLTVDHKIDEPDEWEMVQARVRAGRASIGEMQPGLYRMLRHARGGAVYGISMSRSIGDDQATVSTPEISMFQVSRDDLALVMCSDGIFDTVHNDQVGTYVSAIMGRTCSGDLATRSQRAAEGLVNWCYDTEMLAEKFDASIDNLTALVVPLDRER